MEILTIIKDYIKEPNTDYAILINGAWGSGKTHFLKNSVGQEIKKIPFLQKEKKQESYELVYVSLYGITKIDELRKGCSLR
jgi:hypothetical protein